jgi:hypothetical protein
MDGIVVYDSAVKLRAYFDLPSMKLDTGLSI